jgi:hypothetical protein
MLKKPKKPELPREPITDVTEFNRFWLRAEKYFQPKRKKYLTEMDRLLAAQKTLTNRVAELSIKSDEHNRETEAFFDGLRKMYGGDQEHDGTGSQTFKVKF